jgi:hypothetical protein
MNKNRQQHMNVTFLEQLEQYLIEVEGVLLLFESSNEKEIIGGEFSVTVSKGSSMWIGQCSIVFIIAKSVINGCILDAKNWTGFCYSVA